MGAANSRPTRSKCATQRRIYPPRVSIACDDCGSIFTLSSNVTFTDRRGKCDRCAARVTEQKIAQSPHTRRCGGCQVSFSVSENIAKLPQGVLVSCQRCSDTHRLLIKEGAYMEVTLQRGEESLYVCCPKHLGSELRRCIQASRQQGYTLVNETQCHS